MVVRVLHESDFPSAGTRTPTARTVSPQSSFTSVTWRKVGLSGHRTVLILRLKIQLLRLLGLLGISGLLGLLGISGLLGLLGISGLLGLLGLLLL